MPAPSPRKPRLREIQRAIAGALMRPLERDETMGRDNAAVAARFIKPNDRLDAFERLQIYNQQYWWRLQGAFGEDFRALRAVLGERRFDRLTTAYLTTHGSTSWSLRNLGAHLPAFLGAHPELCGKQHALALDVARVEWARVLAFDDPEKPVLDATQLARVAPAKLKLGLQPYLTLLELQHPVDELMQKLRRKARGTASNAVSATATRRSVRVTVRASRTPIFLAVHRVNFSVYYKRLDPEAYRLLLALRGGATLEAACGEAFADSKELPEQSAERIQGWFARWMEFGWFCKR